MVTAGDTSPMSLRNQFTVSRSREVLRPASIRDKSFDNMHKNEVVPCVSNSCPLVSCVCIRLHFTKLSYLDE